MALTACRKGKWKFFNLPLVHNRADIRTLRLKSRRIGHDRQSFLHVAGLQREVDRGSRVYLHYHACFLFGFEALSCYRNFVDTHAQIEQAIATRRARRSGVDRIGCGVGGRDGSASDRPAGGVEDGAGNRAAVGLGESRGGRGEKEQRYGEIARHRRHARRSGGAIATWSERETANGREKPGRDRCKTCEAHLLASCRRAEARSAQAHRYSRLGSAHQGTWEALARRAGRKRDDEPHRGPSGEREANDCLTLLPATPKLWGHLASQKFSCQQEISLIECRQTFVLRVSE